MNIVKLNRQIKKTNLSKILRKNFINKKTDDDICNFIKMEDITNKINNYKQKKYVEVKNGFSKFSYNDILIAKITPCFENGKGAIVDLIDGGFGSTEFIVLTPLNIFVRDYIYHLTQSKRFRLLGKPLMIGGGGQRRIPKDFITNYEIPHFEDSYYFKIGSFLNIELKKIEKIKSLLEKIEIRNKYYADKLLSGELSIDEEGKIIEEKKTFSEYKITAILTFINGYPFESKNMKNEGKYPVIKMSNFKKGLVNTEIGVKTDLFVNQALLLKNDLIIGLSGSVGEYAFLKSEVNCLLNQRCLAIRSKDSLGEYAKKYIIKKMLIKLKNESEGGVIKNISSNYFNDLTINIPTNYLIINSFLDKLEDEKIKVERLLELEEKRFEWLSDKLLSGEYIIED